MAYRGLHDARFAYLIAKQWRAILLFRMASPRFTMVWEGARLCGASPRWTQVRQKNGAHHACSACVEILRLKQI